MELHFGLPIYLAIGWYLFPMTRWDLTLFLFSYLLILIVELVNTAFETMLDKLHPEDHEIIGRSKDIASAAVFLAFLFAAFVVGSLVVERCCGIDGSGDALFRTMFV
jgi:diacylglycerol kinase